MAALEARTLSLTKVGYWLALGLCFGWATWLRFRLPLEPIADFDVWGYLSSTIHQSVGDGFMHNRRNFVYPGFLLINLKAFGDFRASSAVQHLLGLAAGGFFLATWSEIRKFFSTPRIPYFSLPLDWAWRGFDLSLFRDPDPV